MKELLTYVAQNLVEHPEQVSVTEVEGRRRDRPGAPGCPGGHGQGNRPPGPHRQGDPYSDALRRPAAGKRINVEIVD